MIPHARGQIFGVNEYFFGGGQRAKLGSAAPWLSVAMRA